MDDLSLAFVDDRDMSFMDVFLVDDWLDVLIDHWSVMLMHHLVVDFSDDVLMMLMYDFSVCLFDYWLLNDGLNYRCLLMR